MKVVDRDIIAVSWYLDWDSDRLPAGRLTQKTKCIPSRCADEEAYDNRRVCIVPASSLFSGSFSLRNSSSRYRPAATKRNL